MHYSAIEISRGCRTGTRYGFSWAASSDTVRCVTLIVVQGVIIIIQDWLNTLDIGWAWTSLWPYRPGFRGGAVDQRTWTGARRAGSRQHAKARGGGGGGGLVLYPAGIAPGCMIACSFAPLRRAPPPSPIFPDLR